MDLSIDRQEIATPEAFPRSPRRVWAWYWERRAQVGRVAPNPGHRALAKMEDDAAAGGARFTWVTQNVDGLHHAAGSRRVHELHGNIRRCVACGSLLRRDGVWFGETPPQAALQSTALSAAATLALLGSAGAALPLPA